MLKFNKIAAYFLIFFNFLLLFFWLFEDKLVVPLLLNPAGRLHPLLLHLPIGFCVVLIVFYLFRKEIDQNIFEKILKFLLNLTALSAAIVALFGFLLSKEGGFDIADLAIHKYTGLAVSFISFGLSVFYDRIQFHKNSSGSWSLLIFMAIAGHFGAAITHGNNYLWEAFQPKKIENIFTKNNTAYEAAIFPILEAKCVSCHNDQKTKGQLNMSSIAKILIGGKNGAIWKAGDVLNSHIIERANLSIDDKHHMPPKGKAQLTVDEIELLTAWIKEGADTKKKIVDYADGSITKLLAMSLLMAKPAVEAGQVYTFDAANNADIEVVNTPYCSVYPIANNSPALQADFFVSKNFDLKVLENLSKVGTQLVALNLSKMPLKDSDLSLISKFQNLEKLTLNQTDISGNTIDDLLKCKNLNSIGLIGIKIKRENIEKLAALPKMKELFIWETGIDATIVQQLSKKYPKIKFDKGFVPNPTEILQLNPPIVSNDIFVLKDDDQIKLKHTFKDVKIIYTLDGSVPDSTTKTIYKSTIAVNSFLKIKALATKNGWYASDVITQQFFKYRYQPDSVIFLKSPDKKYGQGSTKILTDLKKGTTDNTQGTFWSGYRENDFAANFLFGQPKPLKGITISYLKNVDAYIMPPVSIEIWAGNTTNDLKLIHKHFPDKPKSLNEKAEVVGFNFPVISGSYKLVKIIAKPVPKLPTWHRGKGEKGWFFVDEVLFY
jgi:uncharacterized membrane protein